MPTLHIRASLNSIFDTFDPSPLPQKKLHPDFMNYVCTAAKDLPPKGPINLCFHAAASEAFDDAEIISDVKRSLKREYEEEGVAFREHFRTGYIALGLALAALAASIVLYDLAGILPLGAFGRFFEEGFLIIGWVALWKPVEILLYDWYPIHERKRTIGRLCAGEVTVERE